jgi:hypothetical protein
MFRGYESKRGSSEEIPEEDGSGKRVFNGKGNPRLIPGVDLGNGPADTANQSLHRHCEPANLYSYTIYLALQGQLVESYVRGGGRCHLSCSGNPVREECTGTALLYCIRTLPRVQPLAGSLTEQL